MYPLICIQNMPVNNYYIFNRHPTLIYQTLYMQIDAYIYLKAVKHIYLSNMQSVAKPINTTCISITIRVLTYSDYWYTNIDYCHGSLGKTTYIHLMFL